MKRIHAFGCSLTHQHKWRYLQHDTENLKAPADRNLHLDITSYAISGGAHNMQFVRHGNAINDGAICEDDIIIWQMTDPRRHGIPIQEKWNVTKKKTVPANLHANLQTTNIYTDKDMGMYTNHLLRQFCEGSGVDTYLDIADGIGVNEDNIYSLLLSISGMKRMNDKLLVMFGWDEGMPVGCKKMMIDFFIKNGIDYIQYPMLDWTLEKGYKQSSTYHPGQDGYKAFTREVMEPKLMELGWL